MVVSWREEVLKDMTDKVGDCQPKEIDSGDKTNRNGSRTLPLMNDN